LKGLKAAGMTLAICKSSQEYMNLPLRPFLGRATRRRRGDNRASFIDHRVLDLLRTWNVGIMYSPAAFPQYNGSCERFVGLVGERETFLGKKD